MDLPLSSTHKRLLQRQLLDNILVMVCLEASRERYLWGQEPHSAAEECVHEVSIGSNIALPDTTGRRLAEA